ncbi:MAG: FHA domain-containing protein [Lachnospiraceae bacterium]|nr:FHA domain-containing protein [Lachnospiraceae bacterium]
MNLTKCSNGHYYDADKYSSCPHCKKGQGTDEDVTVNMERTGTLSDHDDEKTVSMEHSSVFAGEQAQVPVNIPPVSEKQVKSVSLMDAVNVAAAAPAAVPDNDKTVSYYGGSMGTEPVVGWLVCIEGETLGKAFELKNGKNFIGRSQSMDVILEGDPNVSRERHAIVTYEPKGRVFIAQPGESRELFYMNDKVVLMNVEMHDRDILSIGKTRLMFVPLCGPDFAWEDTH